VFQMIPPRADRGHDLAFLGNLSVVQAKALQEDEPRAFASRHRGLALDLDRLLDAAVVRSSVEAERAECRVAEDADLAGVLDDRDDLRAEPARAGPHRERRRERRSVGAE